MRRRTLALTDAAQQPKWHFGMEACPSCRARWLDNFGLIVRVHAPGDDGRVLIEYPVAVDHHGRIDDVLCYLDRMQRIRAGEPGPRVFVRIACLGCGLDVLDDPRIFCANATYSLPED